MAELFGLAVAVLQLLDYSIKGLETMTKVKKAPKTVQDLTSEMKLLQEVIKSVQPDPVRTGPNANAVGLEIALLRCQNDLNKLTIKLRKLVPTTNDGLWTRSWKVAVAISQEKDLTMRLKRHKDSLSLLLEQQHRSENDERFISHY